MRATEFRLIREGLGLTGGWLSSHLEVNPRTIDRWEAGDTAIPEFAARALRDLEQRARDEVAARVDALERWGVQEVSIHETPGSMPARWQRAVAFRVRQEVGDVLIVTGPAEISDPR